MNIITSWKRCANTLNIESQLVLVKNEDKTEKIDCIKYASKTWQIKYLSSPKVYSYSYSNVVRYENPIIIEQEKVMIFEKDKPLSGIGKLLDFGDYIRIIFKNGFSKVYPASSIIIEENRLGNQAVQSCFSYLKALAEQVSVKDEGDLSFLSKQFNYLTEVSPRSVLSAYLERKPLRNGKTQFQPIFPFGFNLSQKAAVEKALTEQVSVIEGPPGTGKTQTILNIISNAILEGKTVAVVSNNNSATSNVLEKLQKYGVDFIAAYLGNSENKKRFFSKQKVDYPDLGEWELSQQDFQIIQTHLKNSEKKLNEMLEDQNKLALLRQERSALETEYEYFLHYYAEISSNFPSLRPFLKYSSDKILKILVDYTRAVKQGKITLRNKLYNLFTYGIYDLRIYKYPAEDMITFLQKIFYSKKMYELQTQIEVLETKLQHYNFEKAMKNYSLASMNMFKAKLADKYKGGGSRKAFAPDALWKNFDSFSREYPLILSTTHSLRTCAEKNYLFDYVIIDEASQVDIVTGALALSCAKNAVVVGDLNQLPNVVSTDIAAAASKIFDSYNLDHGYHYAEQSLLSSILSLYKNVPKTLLKEHYRCHPQIIGFCNQKFYKNELVILTNKKNTEKPMVLYKTVKGNHARGTFNQRQIDVIFDEIFPDQNINENEQSVGIISPYRLQTNRLQQAVGNRKIEADTVHKYQGREKDIIILSTVVNEMKTNDFADDPNLINVAVSRAVEKLIVVVSDSSKEWKGTNIGDLVRYIKYNNFEIIESQIYSVFDLLYSHYSDQMLNVLQSTKNKKNSVHKSEILMNLVVDKVLSAPDFQSLDYVLHQPLRMLIKDPGKLTAEEKKYATNILTHTDFVIFNKMDKMPVLVIEVDGHAYHENNPAQLKRDNMKDRILEKYGIPFIRLKTTGSGEEKKLKEKLEGILIIESRNSLRDE